MMLTTSQMEDFLLKIDLTSDFKPYLENHVTMMNTAEEPSHYETFINAVWEGNLHLTTYLISQGMDVGSHENLATIVAASKGNLSMLKLLILHGGDPHTQDGTALIGAINNDSLSVVRYLLSHRVEGIKHLSHAEGGSLIHELLLDSCSKSSPSTPHASSTCMKLISSYC